MDHSHFKYILSKLKALFDEETIKRLSIETKFCQRERVISPYSLLMSLICAFASGEVDTIADMKRVYNELTGSSLEYSVFHKQRAKKTFPDFLRQVLTYILTQTAMNVVKPSDNSLFASFDNIYLHDGTSFKLKDSLEKYYPGRFKMNGKAAVELHTTMNLLTDNIESITLAPDKESEVYFRPPASKTKNALVIMDRYYFDTSYFKEIVAMEGHYLVRAKKTHNPIVLSARYSSGKSITRFNGVKLSAIRQSLSTRKIIDLDVEFRRLKMAMRMIIFYHKAKKEYVYLVTSLGREEFDAEDICSAYRLRWQIELLFKEWKSYANLKRFDTNNHTLAEGLIWLSIMAAAIKRFLAHAIQVYSKKRISTLTTAKCIKNKLFRLIEAIFWKKASRMKSILYETFNFISAEAEKAYPDRNQCATKQLLGLEYLYGIA